MKVIITGGNGFIAKNIHDELILSHNVKSPSKQELNLYDTSIVEDYLKSEKFDVVVHTATHDATVPGTDKRMSEVLECNLRMFHSLLRCKNYYGKLINMGSGGEYGRQYRKPKMSEDYANQNVPTDPYGLSKYSISKYIECLNGNFYNLRIFAVYGKYENYRMRFISNSIYRAMFNIPICIHQNTMFDFTWIGDVAKIVGWFVENESPNKILNVCSGNTVSLLEVAKKIAVDGRQITFDEYGWGSEYSGDNSLLLNSIGGYKFLSIDLGIKELYNWCKDNKSQVDVKLL